MNMWSKQQDTRNTNKNMTSFKNKITNRKRKNSKTRPTVTENVDSPETDLASKSKQNEEKQKSTKSGKNRGRNRSKKDNNTSVSKSETTTPVKDSKSIENNSDIIKNDLELADVVLRNPTNIKRTNSNNSIKRYSDSIVIDNDNGQIKLREESDVVPPILTRAVSGFFILDQAKKSRRLSDLFRPHSHSTMKLSASTEHLNVKNSIKSEKTLSAKEEKKNAKVLQNSVSAKVDSSTKRNVKSDSKSSSKSVSKDSSSSNSSNSYLKRVRSKIYKSKSEQSVDEVDATSKSRKLKPKKGIEIHSSRIPEDEVATLTPNGVRKSITSFDFRLTRQTSNLERVRPKTMDSDSPPTEKPVLAKAKSSSSINLSLLRTRRNQILEKVASRLGAKDVQNEFDFIAFGGVPGSGYGSVNSVNGLFGSQTSLQKQPSWLHIHKEEQAEVKQSHPVSRSGSDRRPDAVREEGIKQQESSKTESSHDVPNDRMEAANMVSSTILPAAGNHRKHNSNINRSESVKEQSEKRKQRRNISDPSHNTTTTVASGDVDLERSTALSHTESGSSSNSSISCNGRLSESPSNSVDAVTQDSARRGTLDSDSDIDAESEQWQNLGYQEELKNLPPHEKKRHDVINELFHTESSHVRNLKVLYKIFYKKIQESHTLKPDELNLIFPNIKEILDIHTDFNKEMRKRRREDAIVREVGSLLANMFGERDGESLKKAAATFCERQQMALEFIKKRRERDSKFDAVLTECEKKRQCRRLPFQGILPTEMQRLTKYPLLIERLMHSVESNKDNDQALSQLEELANLKRAHQMSKEILNQVNEAAKLAHNKHRLEEIQKHLDTSGFERSEQPIAQEFRTLDLSKFRLILEGSMQLRRPNKPIVPVHILLLEEAVMILHRDSDRFLLKFFQSGLQAQPQPLSPIIKMNMLLTRANAVCKNALFLVNTSANNSQMYDLVVEDEIKREMWFKHFTDATESYNKRQGKSLDRQDPASDSETESVQDLPPAEDVSERAETVGGEESSSEPVSDLPSAETQEKEPDVAEGESKEDNVDATCSSPEMVAGGGIQSTKVSAEEWPLIQPSQVSVAVPPVHVAESMLTPLEQIRRKDAMVKQALEDKEGLVADMLSIPREHFEHIADMASMDPSNGRDPSERVLASIFQVNLLQKAVNDSLNITELDAMAAKGGKHQTCASQQEVIGETVTAPTVPTSLVREIASSLNSQLTTLLSEVKQIEEERDRLRKELHRVRERLHEEHNLHSPLPVDDDNITDCASEQSTCNDSLQIVSKSDCEEEEQ